MQKKLNITTLTRDTTLNINTFLPVESGKLTVRQNAVGGHKVLLGSSIAGVTLVGDVPVLPTPFSETLIQWLCTDNTVYVYSELSPDYSTIITGSTGGGTVNAYSKPESDARFYPLTTNPTGYITTASLNNYYTKAQSDLRYLGQTGGTGGFSGNYNDLTNKPTIPTNTNQLTNGAGFITGYNEVDTLDSVLNRGNSSALNMNVSGAVNLSGSLQIPSTASALPSSIWIGTANSTGSTGGGSGVSYLAALLDVNIVSPTASQALIYNGSKWTNTSIVTDLSSVYTKTESNSLFKPIGYTPAWNDISGRPTALSQFANDAGYITGYSEVDTLNSVLSRGNTSGLNMSVSGKVSLTGELIIPANASTSNQSIWIGNANSTGSTGGGSGASYLSALLDTAIVSPTNGQTIVFNGSKWVNTAAFNGDWNLLINKPDLTKYHHYNTFTADANTVPENTSNFSYAVNAPYNGTLMHFGANNYGTQFNTNYGNGSLLSFRTRNGDAGTWNPWRQVWTDAQFTPSQGSVANSVVQRDSSGYINNTYINTTDDVQPVGLQYVLGKLAGDNFHRSFTVGAVRQFLGLGDLAYQNNSAITLQYVTDRGNTTSNLISVGYGASADPYGIITVTRGTSSDYSYFGMTRSGQIGWGIGIDTSNRIVFGLNANGSSNYTFGVIPHAFDAGGSVSHSGNMNVGGAINGAGSLTIAGASYLKNTHLQSGSILYQYNSDNSLASQSDMRGGILHKYVYKTSDASALSWNENWYNSAGVYHSWTTDSLGFVANSKLTTISSGNGATTYQGSLEVRGTNAGITFHYPAYYAAPLYMDSVGSLVWGGPQFQANTIYGASAVRSAGWLYSNGATGWYNETYGGGMYMQDTTYVRTYNGKAFYCDNFIQSPRIHATSTMVLPLSPSSENGAIWIA